MISTTTMKRSAQVYSSRPNLCLFWKILGILFYGLESGRPVILLFHFRQNKQSTLLSWFLWTLLTRLNVIKSRDERDEILWAFILLDLVTFLVPVRDCNSYWLRESSSLSGFWMGLKRFGTHESQQAVGRALN